MDDWDLKDKLQRNDTLLSSLREYWKGELLSFVNYPKAHIPKVRKRGGKLLEERRKRRRGEQPYLLFTFC